MKRGVFDYIVLVTGIVLVAIGVFLNPKTLLDTAGWPFYTVLEVFVYDIIAIIIGIGLLILFSQLKKRRNIIKKWWKKTWKNLLLLIIVLVIMFIILEVIFAIILYDELNSSNIGPASKRFIEDHYQLNSLGYRDVEHTLEKTKERIVFLGDSNLFAQGLADIEDSFFRRIEILTDYETIALSKPGWTTKDQLNALEDHGLPYDPDIVILTYTLNDAEYNPLSRKSIGKALVKSVVSRFVVDRSYFYYFFVSRLIILEANLHNNDQYWQEKYTSKNLDLEEHRTDLRRIKEICDEQNKTLMVLLLANQHAVYYDPYPFVEAHQWIAEVFADTLVIDTLDYYLLIEGSVENNPLMIGPYEQHPSILAHELIAQVVTKYINALPE